MSETTATTQKAEFGKFQSMFWPVHKHEIKKFIPTSILMFCILFTYTMVRDLKDTFLQYYAAGGGAEVISVVKLFFVLPFAFLVVMFYTSLVNKFGFTKTFYIIISIFVGFFAIFAFILFPNYTHLHPTLVQVKEMQANAPGFLFHIIPAATNWSFTLFYMMSEIWGTMAIASLFWRFANEITMKKEVKRFFGMYALIGNLGVVLSGRTLETMSKAKGEAFKTNVIILITICIALSIIGMMIFRYLNNVVMKDPTLYNPDEKPAKKKKAKIGVLDGIKFLFTNPYLLLIAALVFCYGMSDNLFEVVWKAEMKAFFPLENDYSAMMAVHSQAVGWLTMLSTFIAAAVLRRTKWRTGAVLSPIVILATSVIFFGLIIYIKQTGSGNSHFMGLSLSSLTVFIGVYGVAAFKAIKYTLFDPTKSMAYLPLDDDTKTKGQAAVEVIGGRAGKSGGAATTYVLTNIIAAGSQIASHIYTIVPMAGTILVLWIMSVFGLSKKYEEKVSEQHDEKTLA